MIGLADCNNFFVSCERTIRPELIGRPTVVLSNNDGCVVARSNEAKAMGIKMGQPAFQIRDYIENGELTALSGNHLLYREISLRVHAIFRRFVPSAIDYSVDESFLDVNGIPVEMLPEIGETICDACMREEKIPITVGFAPTKTLAKIATEVSKKAGVRVGLIRNEEEALPYLDRLPISELWGIGRRLSKRLYMCGVYTIGDFSRRNQAWVRQKLGVNGERSWLELHCTPCIELSHVDRKLQDSVSESRTFPEDVDDYDYIRARVVIYASDCAKKLRAMGGKCYGVGVFMRTNPFHPRPVPVRPEGMVRFEEGCSDTPTIVRAALDVLDSVFVPGVPMKRAGVWLSDIVPDTPQVGSLFDAPDPEKENVRKFMSAIDKINGTVGNRKISLASQIVKGHRGHNDGYSSSFQAPK